MEENHDDANLAYFLQSLAIVERAEDAIERVPVLLGAGSIFREGTDNKGCGYYRPDDSLRGDVEDRVRQVLRDREYNDALQAGRRLKVRDIVSFALDRQT